MSSSSKVRVLVIPGLYGSGPAHWQTWLQSRLPRAVRVEQDDWKEADLQRWSARIGEVLDEAPDTPHVAVAHSFGCLALAHCLAERRARPARDDAQGGLHGALFVAPAEPERFRLVEWLPRHALGLPATVFASDTDPWMSAESARRWATAWGAGFVNLGDVGHINAESGFGPLPRALHHTQGLIHRIESARRLARADLQEFSFAV
jgi:predicted alpha/beta hydrolase family esterase